MRMKPMLIVLPILLLFAAAGASFYQWRSTYVASDITLVIEPHHGSQAVLGQLHDQGVLPSPAIIAIPLVLSGHLSQLKAGEYAFTAGMTPAQVIEQIARGLVVIHKVTIPEGWNLFQIRTAFMAEPLLTGDWPAGVTEGSLFPDTMRFQRGQSRASLVDAMQKHAAEMIAKEWAARDPLLSLKTPAEALVMASMVEKETGVPQERAMVAGVFYNRLKIGMKLQSDPTVVYGIEAAHGGQPLGRALTSADLASDTPYNSYTRAGLPPGPICNPGLASLQAALHPATTDALYFVATGHGGHNFSSSLAQHESNVAAYRQATHR